MTRYFRHLALNGMIISALIGAAVAQQPLEFKEIPGVQEFSGELTARPIQFADWTKRGVPGDEAQRRVDAAKESIRRYQVKSYVWQTDEYIIFVPYGKTETQVARELLATGNFQYVEPNWIVYPLVVPNDPLFNNQWHHNANRMRSADGWNIHTGNPSTSVGLCDTGVRKTHQDLQLHRLEGYNAVDMKWESQGGLIDDIYGHGTDTTGCAAANGNNGIGVAGVGWNLSHRMLRVTNSSGGGSSLAILNHAARTAAESGDKVVNTSYSGVDNSTNKETATYIKSLGALSVWAAGNDGRRLTLNDRDADDIIVVGATAENDTKTSWSAYGPFVDVVAPGNNVYTTNRSSDAGYGANSGTSFAAPLTAGLLALIWSYNPSLTPNQVEAILKANCDDLGSAGKDDTYGYGRINVYKALIGTPPPGETLHPNTASTTKGNYISGDAASLGADDDNYWRQGTAYDPTDPAAVINSTMEAAANASQGSYTSGSIKVVEKLNITGPKYRIRGLRDDGSWGVLLDNQAAGMTETTLTTGLSPVNDYVRQANSNELRLELRAASSNRFAFFQHYVDLVEWFLTP